MSKRPTLFDDDVTKEVVELVLPKVIQWMGENLDQQELESLRHDLMDSMDHEDEGYQIAKNLEHEACIQPDRELVEILDHASFDRYNVLKEKVKAWVAKEGVVVTQEVDQRVRVKDGYHLRGKVGKVVRVEPETAEVVVKLDEDTDPRPTSGGYILPTERLEACTST